MRPPPSSPLFPYTTLFRSSRAAGTLGGQRSGRSGRGGGSVRRPHSGSRWRGRARSEEHTSELQSRGHLVCRLLLEKKKRDTDLDTANLIRPLADLSEAGTQ